MAEPLTLTLDGAGTGTTSKASIHGELFSFYVDKGGMTANPTIVITDYLGRELLNTVVTADTEYPLMLQAVDTAGSPHTNIYKNTLLDGRLTVTATGGDANGVFTIFVLAR